MAMFLSRKGVYRSKEETPSLKECLAAAHFAIGCVYSIRAIPDDDLNYEPVRKAVKMINDIAERVKEPGFDATRLANLLNASGIIRSIESFPEASDTTLIAAAYWAEAKQLETSGDRDRSWAALLQCYFYIGAASGPFTHKEKSRLGAKRTQEPILELQSKLIELLNELPEQQYLSVEEAITAVLPKAIAFRDQQTRKSGKRVRLGGASSQHGGQRLINLFKEWSSDKYPKVRAAFVRVLVRQKITPGRPPKKKHLLSPSRPL